MGEEHSLWGCKGAPGNNEAKTVGKFTHRPPRTLHLPPAICRPQEAKHGSCHAEQGMVRSRSLNCKMKTLASEPGQTFKVEKVTTLRVNKLGWTHLNPSCGDSRVSLEPCFSQSRQQEQHLELVKNPGLEKPCFSKPEIHAQHLGLVKITASLVSPRASASYEMPSKVGHSFLGGHESQIQPTGESLMWERNWEWTWCVRKGWQLQRGKPATCPLSVRVQAFWESLVLEGGTCCFLTLASVFTSCPLVLPDPACLCISSRYQAEERGVLKWWTFSVMRIPLKMFSSELGNVGMDAMFWAILEAALLSLVWGSDLWHVAREFISMCVLLRLCLP